MKTYIVYIRHATLLLKNTRVDNIFIHAKTKFQAYLKAISRFPEASISKIVRVS